MEPETINSTELRTKTRDLMERVKFNRESFIVETFGRPMAVLISFEDFMLVREYLNAGMLPGDDKTTNVRVKPRLAKQKSSSLSERN